MKKFVIVLMLLVSIIKSFGQNSIPEIYPNPSNGRVTVTIDDDTYYTIDSCENLVIYIYSIVGQQVREIKVCPTTNTTILIDITDLSNGIYIFRFIHNKRIYNIKVIKQE